MCVSYKGSLSRNPYEVRVANSKMEKMNIVHVVSSLRVGGMEHFVLRVAHAQKQEGHRVTVLALQDGPLHNAARELALEVVVLGGASKIKRVGRALLTYFRLRPDIINAHNETSLQYASLSRRVCAAKIVLTNHGQGSGKPHNPDRKEWRDVAAIVAVSDAVADRMDKATLGDKISTITNGVSFSPAQKTREAVRAELGLSSSDVVGIIVARIDHLKGHDTLLHAAVMLQKKAAPFILLLAGDGAERNNREQMAQELGLKNVRFLGFRSDVPDLLAASDFFVLPSLTEGLPLSILEAMSHGLPTVATDVGGIPELITNGQEGFLVPVNDPALLAQAIETVIRNPALRDEIGAKAHRKAETEFSFTRMTRDYETLYTSLLTGTITGSGANKPTTAEAAAS